MIRFTDIHHLVGERELFDGLTWHIRPGERTGLVGDNGTGKTTLLRMAVGEVEPTSGSVTARRGARIGFLRQEIHEVTGDAKVLDEAMRAFAEEQRAEEQIHRIYAELETAGDGTDRQRELLDELHSHEGRVFHHDAASAEADARKILSGLGFAPAEVELPLATFSGGWQMRAHIARLLLERPDVLLLDEPTNHLDLESIQWLEGFLSGFPGAVVVVSHDRYFLDRITNRTAWLNMRQMSTFTGNYSRFLGEREQQEELLMRRWQNQQDEVAHIERFIERFRYKASKASAVQSRVKMLEKIERIEIPQSARRVRLRIPVPAPSGRFVIELRGVGKAYGDNRVFRSIDLVVESGDKVALVGRNGAGKSTLLKICAGVLDHEGARTQHPKTQLEYFSQHRIDMLNPENSVLDEARPAGAAQTDEQLRTILGCFLFSGDDVFKPVKVLSGGEKSRLAFARMLLRRGNLLLLDEPTNHLDIATRETLKAALADFPGTLVMISHDRSFIDGVANKVIEVADGTITAFPGNYTDYLQRKGTDQDAEAALRGRAGVLGTGADGGRAAGGKSAGFEPHGAMAAIEAAKDERQRARRSQADERRERSQKRTAVRNRINKIQAQIERMETRLAEIHALHADPDAFSSGRMTAEVAAEGKHIEVSLPRMISEWESLVVEHEELLDRSGA